MSTINLNGLGGWRELPFFGAPFSRIEAALDWENEHILPERDDVLAALCRTQPTAVKVVVLGQDPYPTVGHAHGFAFSAAADTRPLPRSLSNIFKEMQADIGGCPPHADLRFWADQGVLLLNTTLTVPAGQAGGHARLGWQELTKQILDRLSDRPRAYLLWGAHAQKVAAGVDGNVNLKIETAHPSPLSARRGFFGSKPFSRTNAWLQAQQLDAINWANPPEAA